MDFMGQAHSVHTEIPLMDNSDTTNDKIMKLCTLKQQLVLKQWKNPQYLSHISTDQ